MRQINRADAKARLRRQLVVASDDGREREQARNWMTGQLTQAYYDLIAGGELDCDAAQRTVVLRLDKLAGELAQLEPEKEGGLLDRLFGKSQRVATPRGLYIHGDVGRGKTMLMDLFFDTVKLKAKLRSHFLSFMQDVHERIHKIRQQQRAGEIWEDSDPIKLVAEQIGAGTRLLCFDEFQVNDIADALMLGRLFEALFDKGVVVVATSNVRPKDLYRDGLNRNAFLPFIDILAGKVEEISLDSPTDYRLGRLTGKQIYLHPLSEQTTKALQSLWFELTETDAGNSTTLMVKGRELVVPRSARGAAWFQFSDLCERPLGAADYIAVASNFGTVFVEDIPQMTAQQRNEAKRFITLIDALYDRRIRLVASAATEPEELYPEGPHRFEFDRTISRLNEMRSAGYFEV